MKSLRFMIVTAAICLFTMAIAPAEATHAWSDYHWARTSNPVALKINYSLTPDWVARTQAAQSDWDVSTVLSLTQVNSATDSQTRRKCSAISGQIRVCNQSYGFNGWLGLASIHIDTNHHIVDGTTKLNDSYFGQAQYNNESEKRHVVCQEVGHDFGLDHQSTSGASLNTCMDYYSNTSDADTKSTTPNQHDYDELGIIYGHTDGYGTASAAPVTSPLLSSASSSLTVTFDGVLYTYTWIYWADPMATAQGLAS